MGATDVLLGSEQRARLDEVSRIELGFPHDFLATSYVRDLVRGEKRARLDGRPPR